ncbi:hypothetical protein PI124_g9928 [Phytophthora idaei]|nr:hypothetical protein PI125_g22853 [Phytophthora idaei]KAG3245327.1 hypothetical protein PI124_g9928 [Phytophthora idaei]
MPANSPFSSFSPSPLSPPQAVLDLRVRAASSTLTSFSPSTLSQPDTIVDLRPSDFGGDFGSNYAEQETNTDADESPSHDSTTAEPPTLRERRVRQRFGPEEDYLLVVQVNGDAPYTAKQGEVNMQWQAVADKLNGSLMRPIKGATAKARFKTLLAKHRSWEAKSATKSGTDESETPFIRAMTELMSNVDDYEAQRGKDAAAKLGEQRAKVHSGEVVRQAAIARIRLGKRNSPSDGAADKDGDGQPSPVNLHPSKSARGADE